MSFLRSLIFGILAPATLVLLIGIFRDLPHVEAPETYKSAFRMIALSMLGMGVIGAIGFSLAVYPILMLWSHLRVSPAYCRIISAFAGGLIVAIPLSLLFYAAEPSDYVGSFIHSLLLGSVISFTGSYTYKQSGEAEPVRPANAAKLRG